MRISQFFAVCLLVVAGSAYAQGRAVVGVTTMTVVVRNSRSHFSYAHAAVRPGTQLAVTDKKNGWYGVLLNNGRTGWVPAKALRLTSTEVAATRERPLTSRSKVPSRTASPAQRVSYTANTALGNEVTRLAMEYMGTRYVWGGNTPRSGLDCSGYVKHVFGRLGISMPRLGRDQMKVGLPITRYADLQPGDRLYFINKQRTQIGHTGIYIGDGNFIHANASAKKVSISYLFTPKWMAICVGARR